MDALDGILFLDEPRHLRVQAHLASVQFGVQHVGGAQAEGVHAGVRNADGADNLRIHRRFQAAGQVRVYDFGRYARSAAGLHEGGLIAQVVFRQGDEQAVGRVYAV